MGGRPTALATQPVTQEQRSLFGGLPLYRVGSSAAERRSGPQGQAKVGGASPPPPAVNASG